MQLNPSEVFIIARQLEDSSDAATYYVRAVIKDSSTTLETIDLTDRGSQFFSKAWTVSPDTTGNGRWITIQSTVYNDASYSVKSTLYGTRLDSYLIQQRVNANLMLGGGGDISYKKVREIVQEEIGKIKIPEPEKISFSPIQNKLSDLERKINGISFDTSPIEAKIADMKESIKESIKNIPPSLKPEKINLSPILTELADIQNALKTTNETMSNEMEEYSKKINNLSNKMDSMEGEFDKSFKQLPVVTTIGDVEQFITKHKPKEEVGKEIKRMRFKETLGL